MSKLTFFDKAKPYAPSIVRIGLALVFVWFGLNQILSPSTFLGYMPSWAAQVNNPTILITSNGVIELVLGILLLVGLLTRLSAVILAIHLLFITFSLGYNDIAVRDIGLTIALVAVAIHGPDKLCYDLKKK